MVDRCDNQTKIGGDCKSKDEIDRWTSGHRMILRCLDKKVDLGNQCDKGQCIREYELFLRTIPLAPGVLTDGGMRFEKNIIQV